MRLAFLILAAVLVAAPASADPLLDRLAGKWRGGGTGRAEPGAPLEAVRCQIENVVGAGGRFAVAGKCAVPGRTGKVRAFVEPVPGAGTYRAEWSNPFGAGFISLRGRPSGDGIRFTFIMRHPETDERLRGTMEWRIRGSAFVIATAVAAEGKPAESLGEMTFERQAQ